MGRTEQVLMSGPNDDINIRGLELLYVCLDMSQQVILARMDVPFLYFKKSHMWQMHVLALLSYPLGSKVTKDLVNFFLFPGTV